MPSPKGPDSAPETIPRTGDQKLGPYAFQIDELFSRVDRNRTGGQKERATPGRSLLVNTGRDDWIRTSAPLLPKSLGEFLVRFWGCIDSKVLWAKALSFWRNASISL